MEDHGLHRPAAILESKLHDIDRLGLATNFGTKASAGHNTDFDRPQTLVGTDDWTDLTGWRPKALADEDGFCKSVMGKFNSNMDMMGEIPIQDIPEILYC